MTEVSKEEYTDLTDEEREALREKARLLTLKWTSEDPSWMKPMQVDPRLYQIEGGKFLYEAKKAILGDEMGVGKTGSAALAWRKTGFAGPALLLGKPAAQSVWIRQADQWGLPTPYPISGTAKQRAKEWKEMAGDSSSFVSSTIQAYRNDLKAGTAPTAWKVVIYDEAHRASNRKTESWSTLKRIKCEYLFLLSGSPMRKGFWDLWGLLNLCDPKTFSSYWKFIQTHGLTQLDEMGHWEILCLRDERNFARRIAPRFLRREKKDVLPELPPKQRILDGPLVEMTKDQERMYNEIEADMLLTLSNSDIIIAQNELVKLTRLRQILSCPKILDPDADYGGNLERLQEMLEETDDHHFVIYTPFAGAVPHIITFLQDVCKVDREIFEFRGSIMTPHELVERSRYFQEAKGIAVCTIDFAESFELTPAEWAYFNGFSWSADANLQAEDRQHRMTTTQSISYYYPQYRDGIDRIAMMPVLHGKARNMSEVFRTHRALRAFLERRRRIREGEIVDET